MFVRARLTCLTFVAIILLPGCSPDATAPSRGYPYQLFVPAAYEADATTRWPLILSLHGAGGLNAADNLIDVHARQVPDFPFIVVAPASDTYWSSRRLIEVLDNVSTTHRVDPARVYITGISMGAYGGYALAAQYPDRFAAMALIAGGGNGATECKARGVELWAFHNRVDPVVPVSESEKLVAAHSACGEQARLTVYEKVPPGIWAHDAWYVTWNSEELYTWFLAQTPPASEVPAGATARGAPLRYVASLNRLW